MMELLELSILDMDLVPKFVVLKRIKGTKLFRSMANIIIIPL